jgi:hypothetical protein
MSGYRKPFPLNVINIVRNGVFLLLFLLKLGAAVLGLGTSVFTLVDKLLFLILVYTIGWVSFGQPHVVLRGTDEKTDLQADLCCNRLYHR